MSYRSTGFLLAALGAPLLLGSAVAEGWTVAKVAGKTWIVSETSTAVPVFVGTSVPAGSTIATGPNGRAMLTNGGDSMLLGPNTKIAVPYKADSGMQTTVFEQTGSVDLTIDRQAKPHFSVQTPYLAAVVKGTVFNVTVADGAAKVSVTRGLVDVDDLGSGQHADVAPGQSAGTSKDAKGLQVSGLSSKPSVRAGIAQKAQVVPASSPETSLAEDTQPAEATSRVSSAVSESPADPSAASNNSGKAKGSKANNGNDGTGSSSSDGKAGTGSDTSGKDKTGKVTGDKGKTDTSGTTNSGSDNSGKGTSDNVKPDKSGNTAKGGTGNPASDDNGKGKDKTKNAED